jgi:hypothetical protein
MDPLVGIIAVVTGHRDTARRTEAVLVDIGSLNRAPGASLLHAARNHAIRRVWIGTIRVASTGHIARSASVLAARLTAIDLTAIDLTATRFTALARARLITSAQLSACRKLLRTRARLRDGNDREAENEPISSLQGTNPIRGRTEPSRRTRVKVLTTIRNRFHEPRPPTKTLLTIPL